MKDIITILHFLFVLALYAGSAINLIVGAYNRDTYNLAMAILLYIIATNKHESIESQESEEDIDDRAKTTD